MRWTQIDRHGQSHPSAAQRHLSYFACNSISLFIALIMAFAAVLALACVLQQTLERFNDFNESVS